MAIAWKKIFFNFPGFIVLSGFFFNNLYYQSMLFSLMPKIRRRMVKVTPGKGYKRPVPVKYRHHSKPRPVNCRTKNY
jgi:hypothetical protein